jgi:LmbE family N-acetylglucosaminyl deacetylase
MFVKLTEEHIRKKISALKAYGSQQHKPYATEDFLRSWARTRGTQIGATYAETFDVIRWVIE